MADLIILILNNNEELTKDDQELLNKIKDKNYIIYVNKNDLLNKLDINKLDNKQVVLGNTLSIDGINSLKNKIIEMFNLEKIKLKDQTYLTNARQKSLATKALNSIEEAIKSLDEQIPVDLIEEDIKECFDTLGEIIGVTYKDELIDEMFSHFCLGK